MATAELPGLLRACKDDPLDDARRLALAEWLAKDGDPDRALLIRRQCGQDVPDDAATEQELLTRNRGRWQGGFADLPGAWQIRRGFLWLTIWVSGDLPEGADLWERAAADPWVEGLELRVSG